jgi:hypothetical protein
MAGAEQGAFSREDSGLIPLPLRIEGLSIDPAEVEAGDHTYIRLTWKGQSRPRNATASLLSYFRSVLEAAASLGRLAVEMHFEEMEYLNSVTVAALIKVIEEARRRQVPLVFVYDRQVKWQELNFRALRLFVTGDRLFRIRAI